MFTHLIFGSKRFFILLTRNRSWCCIYNNIATLSSLKMHDHAPAFQHHHGENCFQPPLPITFLQLCPFHKHSTQCLTQSMFIFFSPPSFLPPSFVNFITFQSQSSLCYIWTLKYPISWGWVTSSEMAKWAICRKNLVRGWWETWSWKLFWLVLRETVVPLSSHTSVAWT